MGAIEQILIDVLLTLFSRDEINAFLGEPRTVAILVGALVAISGAVLGTFLLLRGMSLTSDAISHTVLLGIVVAFMLMTNWFGLEPDISSPLLILGAAAAGVGTVLLTEAIYRSGLVKQDAALGLAFPLLFAVAVILVSRFVDDVHLDEDAVMVGEIGLAWANTNSHCFENCETVIITEDDERAEVTRRCTNCRELNISPRDDGAEFTELCANCGTYTAAQAFREGLTEAQPSLVFWPKALSVMGIMTLLAIGFVTLLYKELKLSTFDSALAAALGFRPGLLNYALMVMVSLVAVGAFDAVGSILVIAFFIIPPATAYLLTDRLGVMLLLSPVIGAAGAVLGYDLARGETFGIAWVSEVLRGINSVFGLDLGTTWDTSISASMVMMLFIFFALAWVLSPKYGLLAVSIRRMRQRRVFTDQVVLAHVYNHEGTEHAANELAASTLYTHFRWRKPFTDVVLARLRALNLLAVQDDQISLTERGRSTVERFNREVKE